MAKLAGSFKPQTENVKTCQMINADRNVEGNLGVGLAGCAIEDCWNCSVDIDSANPLKSFPYPVS